MDTISSLFDLSALTDALTSDLAAMPDLADFTDHALSHQGLDTTCTSPLSDPGLPDSSPAGGSTDFGHWHTAHELSGPDWTSGQHDLSSAFSPDTHHLAAPRSAAAAEKALEWADWYQKEANRQKDWTTWAIEHDPENASTHARWAAEAQANADAKRQEAQDALNK